MATKTARVTHTPGPWTLQSEQHDSWGDAPQLVIRGAEHGLTRPLIVQLDERDEANARLIAAAPDLLEACQLFVAGDEARFMSGYRSAIAAIAKAESTKGD